MSVYYKKNTGFIGVPKHGKLKLEYMTPYKIEINPKDEIGDDTNKSYVILRFHSSKELAEMTPEQVVKLQGAFHSRIFEYNGIDKSESELIDWVFSEPNLNPVGHHNINIKGATQI